MKRFTEIGFWLGVICACVPLLMYLFGNASQWQLHRQWQQTVASHSTSSSDAAPSNTAPSNTAPSNTAPSGPAPSGPAPSDTANEMVQLRIPRLNVNAMVVGDVTDQALAEGPGHYPHTAMPGQKGNCVIAAHRNIWGSWFANLDQMQPGDQVILGTPEKEYRYSVIGTKIVNPDDLSVLKPNIRKPELTLITCTIPPTRRMVVRCILDSSSTG